MSERASENESTEHTVCLPVALDVLLMFAIFISFKLNCSTTLK